MVNLVGARVNDAANYTLNRDSQKSQSQRQTPDSPIRLQSTSGC